MAQPPSIKGRIFATAIEDLTKLLAAGELRREELGRWLKPGDLPVLDQPIVATEWYCIQTYARVCTLLRDVAGGGNDDYLRKRGERSALKLLEAGLYAQLEYLKRAQVGKETDPNARHQAFGRDLKLLTTMSASILNFSHWESKPDPDVARRYVIEVTEARDFPDALGFTSEGFVNGMAKQHGDADLWRWERARADLVVLRMIREI
jgi:hypothetical protein